VVHHSTHQTGEQRTESGREYASSSAGGTQVREARAAPMNCPRRPISWARNIP